MIVSPPIQKTVSGMNQTGKKKPLFSQRLFNIYITIVGAQKRTRTSTKLLAST